MGAVFKLPFAHATGWPLELTQLQQGGFKLLALHLQVHIYVYICIYICTFEYIYTHTCGGGGAEKEGAKKRIRAL